MANRAIRVTDPDLSQHLYCADIRDEVQSVGADECAGDQESRDRGKPKLVEYEDDGDRHREDHEQICKDAIVSHDRNRSGVRSEGVKRGKFFERFTPHVSRVQNGEYRSSEEGTRQSCLFNGSRFVTVASRDE